MNSPHVLKKRLEYGQDLPLKQAGKHVISLRKTSIQND